MSTPLLTKKPASCSCSPAWSSRICARSNSTSALEYSAWLATEVYSPAAMENAPAARPASPARMIGSLLAEAAAVPPATPMMSEKFDTSPSMAPNTAGRNQPPVVSVGSSIIGVLHRFGRDRAAAFEHKIRQREDEKDHWRPYIDPEGPNVVGRVDAHELDPGPTCGVDHDVQREHAAAGQPVLPVDPQDQECGAEVPERFVQERGVKCRELFVAVRSVDRVDLQTPRQVRGFPKEFLVEVIAPAADRLSDEDSRRERIGDAKETDLVDAASNICTERAESDGAPDAESALPDVQRFDRAPAFAEVQLVVGDDVVNPRADDTERDRPHRDVGDEAALAAACDPAFFADPDGDERADDDSERVSAQRDGTKFQHAAGRTRYGRCE